MLGKDLTLYGLILAILYSLKFSMGTYTYLSFPHIQPLYLCLTPLFDKLLQFLESILSELGLFLAPSQISREIITSPKRNNGQINQ